MKLKHKTFTFLVLLALIAMPTSSVLAQGPGPGNGRVIFGSNISIEDGETFEGDLVLFGGNVTIEEGAALDGNLVVIGGNVSTSGDIDGDVVVVGGQIHMENEALVTGDVVLVGGQIERDNSATIEGELVNNVAPQIDIPNGSIPPNVPAVPSVPSISSVPGVVNVNFNPFTEFGQAFVASLLMGFFAMLVALFFQKRLDYVSQAVMAQPVMAGGVGLLSVFVAFALFLTIIPLVALGLAWLFGVVAIGSEIGDRLGKAVRQDWTPVVNAGIGAFVDAINNFSWIAGCFTWVLPVLIGLLAVGGVVLTRFGAKPVQIPGLTVSNPPTNSGDELPAVDA